MGKLNALAVKAATLPGVYSDGGGLTLVVSGKGSRSWMLRTQVAGKRRDFGLGSARDVSLAEARVRAEETRKLYKGGVDPVAKKRAERLARSVIPTFRDAVRAVHEEHGPTWRNEKHRKDWLSSLERYAFAALGDLRIDAIDAPAVRDALLPIWLERPETSRRVRQRIKTVLDWAASKGFRAPLDLSGLAKGLPRQPRVEGHFAAMDYADVPAFVRRVMDAERTMGRRALLFTILTAARSGETRGATWSEIDLEAATWTIPAGRMKAGKGHVVPLSAPALALLRDLPEGKAGDVLFASTKGGPLSDMTLSKIMRDMKLPFTVHGFRSAFKDWASETTNFPDAVSEAALAHKDADKVRASYRRTDFFKRRVELMATWGQFLVESEDVSSVLPLVRAVA